MICQKCGVENRAGARFCRNCRAVLEPPAAPPPPPAAAPPPVAAPPPPRAAAPPPRTVSPPTVPSPPRPTYPPSPPQYGAPAPAEERPAGAGGTIGRLGMIGGLTLVIVGALITGGVFFLPWFVSGGTLFTGLDTVTMGLQPGGDMAFLGWSLVPLGALGLLGVGGLCVVLLAFGRKLSPGLSRVVSLLPLLLILSGLCGCGPIGMALLGPLWNPAAGNFTDVLATKDYGFWGAVAGLGMAIVGALVMFIGGLMSRRRAAS